MPDTSILLSDISATIFKNKRNWSPWFASLLTHCALIGVILLIPSPKTHVTVSRENVVMPLVYYPPPKVQPVVRPRVIAPPVSRASKRMPAPPVTPPPVEKAPVKQFAIVHETPQPAAVRVPKPVLQEEAPPAQMRLTEPALATRLPAAPPVVKTGVFGTPGNSPNGHVPSPRLAVNTGGFSGYDGNPGRGTGSGRSSGAVHTGAFGDSAGTESAASGSGRSSAGVHTGAFGDSAGSGAAAPGSGNGRPALVADAGFGNGAAQGMPQPQRRADSAPAETPVEVLWKPKPVYTAEARARKLEGNVTLEVVFCANGEVRVLRVVRGLGSGLDESARAAAEQIRFRPGKKNGVPVDRTGVVLITFELS